VHEIQTRLEVEVFNVFHDLQIQLNSNITMHKSSAAVRYNCKKEKNVNKIECFDF